MPRRLLPCSLAAMVGIAIMAAPADASPKVVASIKPIHALIAGVMEGIDEPGLIVAGSASPHVYTLRPSDARLLTRAQIVFWVGPIFEGFLVKPLSALSGAAEIIELDAAPGMKLLPAREGGAWEEDDHDHQHHAVTAAERDGHLWLDPDNAKAIVRVAVARLSAFDPGNAERYAANGVAMELRLGVLDARLGERLTPIRGVPFVVFHDAYQYLEHRYGLSAIGSITVGPEVLPGARRIERIRAKIVELSARCIFSEPQFESALVQTVTAGTPAGTGVLDPEGTMLAPGPGLYETLMNGLADGLVACLDHSR